MEEPHVSQNKDYLEPIADMGNAWRVARDLRPITLEYGNVDWSGTVYPAMPLNLQNKQASRL